MTSYRKASSLKSSQPSKGKAKKMLKDGKAQGKPLSDKQKGLFGAIAGGRPTKGPMFGRG